MLKFGGNMTTEQLISMPLISLYDEQMLGIVTNVYVYRNKIIALLIVDDDNYDEYVLFTKDLYSIGANAAIVTNSTKLYLLQSIELSLNKYLCPLGHMCVSLDGNIYSRLTNISFDTKYNITSVSCANQQYTDMCFWHNLCIVGKTKHKHLYKPKTKIFNTSDTRIVQTTTTPPLQNISMLIGKHTTEHITSNNGEILVRKNTKITPSIVAKLGSVGKLKELQLHSN